jgi:hypothetical protein
MGWITLVEGNDWGVKFYAPYPCPGTWSKQRDGVLSNAGKRVRVRWPNGAETVELVSTRIHSQMVSDHGKDYMAGGEYDVLMVMTHGVPVSVPLNTVEVWAEEWPRASDGRRSEER